MEGGRKEGRPRVLLLVDGGSPYSAAASVHVLSLWEEEAGVPLTKVVDAAAGLGWGAAVALAVVSPDSARPTALGPRFHFLTEPSGLFGSARAIHPVQAARAKRALMREAFGPAALSTLKVPFVTGLLDIRRRAAVPISHSPAHNVSLAVGRFADVLTATPGSFAPVRLSESASIRSKAMQQRADNSARWFADASRVWSREAFALYVMQEAQQRLFPGEQLVVVRVRAGSNLSARRTPLGALQYGGLAEWDDVEATARDRQTGVDLQYMASLMGVQLLDIAPVVPKGSTGPLHRAWREAAADAYEAARDQLAALVSGATGDQPAQVTFQPAPPPMPYASSSAQGEQTDDEEDDEEDDGSQRNEEDEYDEDEDEADEYEDDAADDEDDDDDDEDEDDEEGSAPEDELKENPSRSCILQ